MKTLLCHCAVVGLVAAGLSGCGSSSQADFSLTDPDFEQAPRRAVAEQTDVRHTVFFATDSDLLAESEREALAIFISSADSSTRITARVLGHADERASDSYNIALSSRRAANVAAFLRTQLADAAEISVTAFGERVPARLGSNEAAWQGNRRVDVVLSRYQLSVPGCDGHGNAAVEMPQSVALKAFGCASAANLAAMIADPADLADVPQAAARQVGPPDTDHESGAIARYRADELKWSTDASATK